MNSDWKSIIKSGSERASDGFTDQLMKLIHQEQALMNQLSQQLKISYLACLLLSLLSFFIDIPYAALSLPNFIFPLIVSLGCLIYVLFKQQENRSLLSEF